MFAIIQNFLHVTSLHNFALEVEVCDRTDRTEEVNQLN